MNSWAEIYNYWQASSVPKIEIISFDVAEHHSQYPWFNKLEDSQYYDSSNPIRDTAYHLCASLKDKDDELIAAFKIFAFARDAGFLFAVREFTDVVFQKFDENRNWWNWNAKYLIPDTKNFRYLPSTIYDLRKKDVPADVIVKGAVEKWKDLSEEWCIIELPKHLKLNDPKRRELEQQLYKKYEEVEYQRYLYLKNKYEK